MLDIDYKETDEGVFPVQTYYHHGKALHSMYLPDDGQIPDEVANS